jgi:hypothetical protein
MFLKSYLSSAGGVLREGAESATNQNYCREAYRWLCSYALGLKGVVVGEGDTYEEALADVKSAIRFYIETFGPDVLS